MGKALVKNMMNEDTKEFVSTLTDTEIKLRLLELRSENVNIPSEAPDVPPPPPNYDFYYK